MQHALYLCEPMVRPRETFDAALEVLSNQDFDAIVCTGVSGLLLAPAVATTMGKHLAVVRKEKDSNHSEFRVEHNMHEGDTWIFLDDLIASGATLHRVRDTMEKMGYGSESGTYLYNDRNFLNTQATFAFWPPANSSGAYGTRRFDREEIITDPRGQFTW